MCESPSYSSVGFLINYCSPNLSNAAILPLQCAPLHFPPRKVLAASLLLLAASVLLPQPLAKDPAVCSSVRGLPPRATPDTNWLGGVPGVTDSEMKVCVREGHWVPLSGTTLAVGREAGLGRERRRLTTGSLGPMGSVEVGQAIQRCPDLRQGIQACVNQLLDVSCPQEGAVRWGAILGEGH